MSQVSKWLFDALGEIGEQKSLRSGGALTACAIVQENTLK